MEDETLVGEAPPQQTLEELQATVQAHQDEYEALREQYAQLWQRRRRADLPDEGYIAFLKTEDRMAFLGLIPTFVLPAAK